MGENNIQSTKPYSNMAPSLSTLINIGIRVKEGQNNRISRPIISNFEFGLLMDDEANTTKFSCLNLNNCNVGIGFKDVGQIVNDVYDFNSGGSPRSVGASFNSVMNRVYFMGNNSPNSPKKFWYFNAFNANENPNNFTWSYFSSMSSAPQPSCTPLPSYKTNWTRSCEDFIELYGINLLNTTEENLTVIIYNLFGSEVYRAILESNNSIELSTLNGIYILSVELNDCRHVEKIIVH